MEHVWPKTLYGDRNGSIRKCSASYKVEVKTSKIKSKPRHTIEHDKLYDYLKVTLKLYRNNLSQSSI